MKNKMLILMTWKNKAFEKKAKNKFGWEVNGNE